MKIAKPLILMLLLANPSLSLAAIKWDALKFDWRANKTGEKSQAAKPAQPAPPILQENAQKKLARKNPEKTSQAAKEPVKPHRSPMGRLIKEKVPYTVAEQAALDYKYAQKLISQGNKAEAAFQLEKIIDKLPTHVDARSLLIDYYLNLRDTDKVAQLLRDGLNLDAKQPIFIKQQALLLHEQADYNKALSVLLTMPKEQLDEPEYKTLLALTYLQEGLYELAQKHYSQLLRTEPRNSNWCLGLAIAQDAAGGKKQALANFAKASSYGGLDSDTLKYIQQRMQSLQGSSSPTRSS